MTFHTVGQALRWYVRATAQADGVRSVWPDQEQLLSAPGQAADQEERRLMIWAIGEALALLDQADQALLINVRVFEQPPEYATGGRRRREHARLVSAWRMDRAEGVVAGRLRKEGLLEAN